MKFFSRLPVVLALAGVPFVSAQVCLESLLDETVDDTRLALLPEIPYTAHQASSRDRASVSADKAGWFANADWSWFIREEKTGGRTEHVMMEDAGPGAVVRLWATWFAGPNGELDGRKNHATNGVFRIYLDGNPKPVIEGTQRELLVKRTIIPEPFAENAQPSAPAANQCYLLYLPIPYAKSCKITYETKGELRTDWGKGEALYYLVGYRKYPVGTSVKTFSPADLNSPVIAPAGRKLLAAPARPAGAKVDTLGARGLGPGEVAEVRLTGPAAIRELRFRFADSTDAAAVAAALRGIEVQLDFDGEDAVRVPVGDFFATGTRIATYRTRLLEATSDKTLVARWVMPFARRATVRFVNKGKVAAGFSCEVATAPWEWTDRSMHFRAVTAPAYGVRVEGGTGTRDMNFATIAGRGRLVGDTLAIVNHYQGPGDAWWGEGDEKIYVDGEKFPSHFGTGTEDYYGYSHCRPEAFWSPFHAQPYGDGNMWPGKTTESRQTVNTRLRLLDDILFTRSLQFDMELWHWKKCTVDFVPTTFYYLLPSGVAKQAE